MTIFGYHCHHQISISDEGGREWQGIFYTSTRTYTNTQKYVDMYINTHKYTQIHTNTTRHLFMAVFLCSLPAVPSYMGNFSHSFLRNIHTSIPVRTFSHNFQDVMWSRPLKKVETAKWGLFLLFWLLPMKKVIQDVSEWAAQSETATFIVQVDRVREKKAGVSRGFFCPLPLCFRLGSQSLVWPLPELHID